MGRITATAVLGAMLLLPSLAGAGKLDDFEKDATKPASKETKESQSQKEDVIGSIFSSVVSSASNSGSGGGSGSDIFSSDDYERRRAGEALTPIARLDVGYQFVESDVSALDVRAEIGYQLLGFQARHTHYWERNPVDQMGVTQVDMLVRLLRDYVELDMGPGALILDGNNTYSGFSVTTPLLIHPSEHAGFEFRPAWSFLEGNVIQDYDLALMGGWKYFSVKAGYRWFRSKSTSLNGPEVGVSFHW